MAVHGRLSLALAFVLAALSTIVVGLRLYSKHFLVHRVTPSDYVMFLAMIGVWGSVVINWYFILYLDYSHVTDHESLVEVVTGSLLSLWIYRINYILDLGLLKTSILLFFRHITFARKSFQNLVGGLLAIILIGSASMIVATVFSCYPIADAWSADVFMRGLQGDFASQCYNPGPFWLGNAAYNLVTDILIWSLPIVFFLQLETIMPVSRRLEILAIFSVGIVAVAASAIRLRILILWQGSSEGQKKYAGDLMIWSQVEQNTGIIVGSMIFLRPLFRRLLSKRRVQTHGPAIRLDGEEAPEQAVMPRELMIPSPTPTIDDREFSMPKKALAPIELRPHCTWGSTIWDGTQVRQVLT